MENSSISAEDQKAIDVVVKKFYSIFTNANQQQPDWSLIDKLCIPETIIIKKTGAAATIYSLRSFIEPRKAILSDGTLTQFEESETGEQTIILGNMAQRCSRFQKSGYLNASFFKGHGNKMFQLIKTNNNWTICSVVWEDE